MGVEPSIFILSEKEYEGACNLPVILIKYLTKKINLSSYEALVFSSKNGVVGVDRLNQAWKKIPSYSIGSGTSKEIKKRGGKVVYEARSSYGDNFASEIKKILAGKKTLFLRAKVVTSNLNSILKANGVLLDEMIVYETVCGDCEMIKAPPGGSFIIFSSPSTIECFFRCFSWDKSYTAIVIGAKTASFMPSQIPYVTAPKQTINSCIELSYDLRQNII